MAVEKTKKQTTGSNFTVLEAGDKELKLQGCILLYNYSLCAPPPYSPCGASLLIVCHYISQTLSSQSFDKTLIPGQLTGGLHVSNCLHAETSYKSNRINTRERHARTIQQPEVTLLDRSIQ